MKKDEERLRKMKGETSTLVPACSFDTLVEYIVLVNIPCSDLYREVVVNYEIFLL